MADCNVTLALSYGSAQPYVGKHLRVGPVVPFVDDTYWVTSDFEDIPLTNPPMVRAFEQGQTFGFIEPDGTQVFKQIPATANTTYAAIPSVLPTPGPPDFAATPEYVDETVAQAAAREAAARQAVDQVTAALVDYADRTNVLVDWAATNSGGAVPATNAQVASNQLSAINNTNPGGAIIPFGLTDTETGHISGLIYWKAAAAATPVYIGIDTGTAGHAPVTGTPDGVHIGITSAAARTNAYGSTHNYLIGQSDAPVAVGANPTVDVTYVFSIDIGLEWISFSLRKLGSDSDLYSWWISRATMLQQAAPKRITGISLYLTATAGGASHKIGPVTATKSRQPARTRTLGGQLVDGADHVHLVRPRAFGSSERWRIEVPKDYSPLGGGVDVALFMHWAITADSATPWVDTRMRALTRAVCDAGLIFASASDGGLSADRYGSPLSLSNYLALYKHVRDLYPVRNLFLIGASGGGVPAMNALSHPGFPTPAGVVMISPATDLAAVYALDPLYAGLIRSSYGIAADGSDYAARTATYDPALRDGADFRGVPTQWFTSNADTVVPRGTHVTPMVNKLAPYAAETSVEVQTGAHLAADQFQAAKVIAFINRHR